MLTDRVKKRMKIAESTRSGTNCIGTVLYVLGVSNYDTYIGSGEKRWEDGIVENLLEKMIKIQTPKEGAVLVIRGDRVEHMGIIVQEEPPGVYHRPGYNGFIEPNTPLADVISRYQYPTIEIYTNAPSARD